MDDDDFDDYDREVELALYREYRDVVSQFQYVVETERRFYLANEVEHNKRHNRVLLAPMTRNGAATPSAPKPGGPLATATRHVRV